MNPPTTEKQSLLRNALWYNALFSILSGLAILVANHWLVRFLGLPEQVSLIVFGVSLIGYAALLLINARRPEIKTTDAWAAIIMDAVWVAGSFVLIFSVPFSAGGKWLIVLLAEVVMAFAVWQIFGIRRLRKGQQTA